MVQLGDAEVTDLLPNDEQNEIIRALRARRSLRTL